MKQRLAVCLFLAAFVVGVTKAATVPTTANPLKSFESFLATLFSFGSGDTGATDVVEEFTTAPLPADYPWEIIVPVRGTLRPRVRWPALPEPEGPLVGQTGQYVILPSFGGIENDTDVSASEDYYTIYYYVQHIETGKEHFFLSFDIIFDWEGTCDELEDGGMSGAVKTTVVCDTPKIEAGFVDGTFCRLYCYDKHRIGATLEGPNLVECVQGDWISPNNDTVEEIPSCNVIECDGPPEDDPDAVCDDDDYKDVDEEHSYMTSCYIWCEETYECSSSPGKRRRRDIGRLGRSAARTKRQTADPDYYALASYTCNSTGDWEQHMRCSDVATEDAWKDSCESLISTPIAHGEMCCFGESCSLHCEAGYMARQYEYYCGVDTDISLYEEPLCTASCHYPWEYAYSEYSWGLILPDCPYTMHDRRFDLGEQCHFGCDFNYQLGNWSSPGIECAMVENSDLDFWELKWQLIDENMHPYCEFDACPNLPEPQNGEFVCSGEEGDWERNCTISCYNTNILNAWAKRDFYCYGGAWEEYSIYMIEDCHETSESTLELPYSIEIEAPCGDNPDAEMEFPPNCLAGDKCFPACNCTAPSLVIHEMAGDGSGTCRATASFDLTLENCDDFVTTLGKLRDFYIAVESMFTEIWNFFDDGQKHKLEFESPNSNDMARRCDGGAEVIYAEDGSATCSTCARGSIYNQGTGSCDDCPSRDSIFGHCLDDAGEPPAPSRRRRGFTPTEMPTGMPTGPTPPMHTGPTPWPNTNATWTEYYCQEQYVPNTMIWCEPDNATNSLVCNRTCHHGYVQPINSPSLFSCDFATGEWSIDKSPECIEDQAPLPSATFWFTFIMDNDTCSPRDLKEKMSWVIYNAEMGMIPGVDINQRCPTDYNCTVGIHSISCEEDNVVSKRKKRETVSVPCRDVDPTIIDTIQANTTSLQELLDFLDAAESGSPPNSLPDALTDPWGLFMSELWTFVHDKNPEMTGMTGMNASHNMSNGGFEEIQTHIYEMEAYYQLLDMAECRLAVIAETDETVASLLPEFQNVLADVEWQFFHVEEQLRDLEDDMESANCMNSTGSGVQCSDVNVDPSIFLNLLGNTEEEREEYANLSAIISWLYDNDNAEPFPLADGYDIFPEIETYFANTVGSIHEMSDTAGTYSYTYSTSSTSTSSASSSSSSTGTSTSTGTGTGSWGYTDETFDSLNDVFDDLNKAENSINEFYDLMVWMLCGLGDNGADAEAVRQSIQGLECYVQDARNQITKQYDYINEEWIERISYNNMGTNEGGCFQISDYSGAATGFNGGLSDDTLIKAESIQENIDSLFSDYSVFQYGLDKDNLTEALNEIIDLPITESISKAREESDLLLEDWSMDPDMTKALETGVATYLALLNGFMCQLGSSMYEYEQDEALSDIIGTIENMLDELNSFNCEMKDTWGSRWSTYCEPPKKRFRVTVEASIMVEEPDDVPNNIEGLRTVVESIGQCLLDEGIITGTLTGNAEGGIELRCPLGREANQDGWCVDKCSDDKVYDPITDRCGYCGNGNYYNSSSNQCDDCPEGLTSGWYEDRSADECREKCEEGHYSEDGMVPYMGSCTKCPQGEFQDQKGQSRCKKCNGMTSTFTKGNVDANQCTKDFDMHMSGTLEVNGLIQDETRGYTLGVWMKFTSKSQWMYLSLSDETEDGYTYYSWSLMKEFSQLSVYTTRNGYAAYGEAHFQYSSSAVLGGGKWEHFAITYDNEIDMLKLYRDGEPVPLYDMGAGPSPPTFPTGQTGPPGMSFPTGQTGPPGMSFPTGQTGPPGMSFPPGQTGPPEFSTPTPDFPASDFIVAGNAALRANTKCHITGDSVKMSGLYFASSVASDDDIKQSTRTCDFSNRAENGFASDSMTMGSAYEQEKAFQTIQQTCGEVIDVCANHKCSSASTCEPLDDSDATAAKTAGLEYKCICPTGLSSTFCDELEVEEVDDAQWSDWTATSACSVSCGDGTVTFTRTCTVFGECAPDATGNNETTKVENCTIICKECASFNDTYSEELTDATFVWTESPSTDPKFDIDVAITCKANTNFAKINNKLVSEEAKLFQCGPGSNHEWPIKSIPTCVEAKVPKQFQKTEQAKTEQPFPCSEADAIALGFAEAAQNASTCATCTYDASAPGCTAARRRKRAATSSDIIYVVTSLDTSGITDADIANMYTTNTVPDALLFIVQDIAAMDTDNIATLTLVINNQSYAINGSSVTTDSSASCDPGYYSDGGSCVPCGAGTYHDSLSDFCVECAIGSYQPTAGQSSCISCADGYTTTNTGSTSSTRCIVDTTATEEPDEDGGSSSSSTAKTVGIAVGASVGAALVCVAAVIGIKAFVGANAATGTTGFVTSNVVQPQNVARVTKGPFPQNYSNMHDGVNNTRFHTPPDIQKGPLPQTVVDT